MIILMCVGKEGEEIMQEVQRVIEMERIVNLARGFGWEKIEEKVVGDKITLTIEKTITAPVVAEP